MIRNASTLCRGRHIVIRHQRLLMDVTIYEGGCINNGWAGYRGRHLGLSGWVVKHRGVALAALAVGATAALLTLRR